MTVDLEEVAVALDAFPHWDETMRDDVFHAIDTAPVEPLTSWSQSDDYFKDEGHAAWERVRTYVLSTVTPNSWAISLHEAAGGESAPTKEEILKALHRGARMIR